MDVSSETDYIIRQIQTEKEKALFTNSWYSVWRNEGYATYNDKIIEKYARYEAYSIDYGLFKENTKIIGTLRIINHSNDTNLPVLNDFEIYNTFSFTTSLCEAT